MKKQFLYDLLSCPSVSGQEVPIQKLIQSYMELVCDSFLYDNSSTLVGVIHPSSKCKVMLCAHADEIGFYITRICENGLVKVMKAGGVHPVLYLGTHVQVINEKGVFHGVVASYSELEQKETVTDSDLYIDMGFHDRVDALQYVNIGDTLCASMTYQELVNQHITGRALDDKAGVFIIMEAMRRANEKGAMCGMYGASTSGEETTRRGAYYASSLVKPTCAIIVDVTFASDTIGVENNETGDVLLGDGPVLCHSSTVNANMNKKMAEIAQRLQIPLQWEVTPGLTHTDGDTIFMNQEGIPICLVSLPLRYMHSSIETASWKDIEYAITLISEFLVEMREGFSFSPFENSSL